MSSSSGPVPDTTAAGATSAGPPGTNPAPNNQIPGHTSFRRQRASRACETCHARKVRCDAASLGVPCTNCTAFSIECKIPTPKRKKNQSKQKDDGSVNGDSSKDRSSTPDFRQPQQAQGRTLSVSSSNGNPSTTVQESITAQAQQGSSHGSALAHMMKPKFSRAPIREAGRVAYLGESSNLSLLVQDRNGTADVVHYPLPESIRGSRARLTELDQQEIAILDQRGAFLLPPRSLCDEVIEAYFRWVAPVVPVINRSRFMRRYHDKKNPPSLLLLQAMLLAGSRVCTNPQLMDSSGSTAAAAMTFFKRAKALYDANYEDDRITIVQALVLMGWYWEGPEDVTKNVFYWTRIAITVAQGSGMHRSVENSQLSRADKRLWKRIWWTLFTRDRSVAVALGRPTMINTDESDVEMMSEEDFLDDDTDHPAEYQPEAIHVQFFMQYVKLCEIMGLVLSQQYSVASKARRTNAIDLTHSDMALADWLQNCPREVYWERARHNFWSALLHSNYYTTLCLLHRAHMPPATSQTGPSAPDDMAYPSRNIAFQAAGMITSIVENLQTHDELKFTPAFIVYSLFSALIMHVYQMRSNVPGVVAASQERIQICMNAMKEVSKHWLVAKMVQTLFESILGNRHLEERLQKAAGKRHQKMRSAGYPVPPQPSNDPVKRKFDDMAMGFSSGPPAPQVSYERSRPQSPVGGSAQLPPGSTGLPSASPNITRAADQFLPGMNSRGNTRPTTPFNPGYSVPATPPDLFLVTRNSPPISQQLWENFQPEQLFPEGSGMSGAPFSPSLRHPVDPQLPMTPQMPNMQGSGMVPGVSMAPPISPPDNGTRGMNIPTMTPAMHTQAWTGVHSIDGLLADHHGQDDTWSNSSTGAPIVPTTLNVEDWFHFFGINGDMNGMNLEQPR